MESDERATASAINGKVRRPTLDDNAQKNLLASGGALGAIAMSSCCVLPLVLFSLGVTGAWIGNLTVLYPYKLYFFVATAGFLSVGFWKIYRKPEAAEFSEGSYCASPASDKLIKTALWSSTVLVAAALVFPYAAPLFLDY